MRLLWEDRAWSDYLYWQTQDKKTLKRINGLIKDIQRSTFEGIGKPEPLKENLSGMWSRRIDDTNRIVYYEKDEIIYIVSCKGHYEDWKGDGQPPSFLLTVSKKSPWLLVGIPTLLKGNSQRARQKWMILSWW